jgi:amino acid transporter
VQGGLILRLAGPLAVLLAFALLGLLAWAVMQCIAEMLCIWPISGALTVYVSEFVDVELGIAVGVAYWYVFKRFSISLDRLICFQVHVLNLLRRFNRSNSRRSGILDYAKRH